MRIPMVEYNLKDGHKSIRTRREGGQFCLAGCLHVGRAHHSTSRVASFHMFGIRKALRDGSLNKYIKQENPGCHGIDLQIFRRINPVQLVSPSYFGEQEVHYDY